MDDATALEAMGVLDAESCSAEKRPIAIPGADDNYQTDRPLSPFERLPDEIIEQILQATDPNGFASLVLLNSKWRSVSQQAPLYAQHLSGCASYTASHAASTAPSKDRGLPELRRLFAQEVKRNLFEAYLRPKQTIVKLVSNSISSSSCPGGEGMQFNPSPKGHHLLAYNSSRIYVLDVRGAEIEVKRELKILRRPAATCIWDDGSLLAVLLTEMQIDIYDLTQSPPRRTQSLILDHSPRAIALSPCGTVLAAAYEGGIEVSSLSASALASDRRSVKCDAVDALAFSFDGTQILGTTVYSSQPSTVILTAPYYEPVSHVADENISALWTASILFPNTSRDCSHAVLLQNTSREEAGWTFTYDRSFETFRAVRIDDLRNGTTYFTGPLPSPDSQAKLLPSTLPAASYTGDVVAASFQAEEIWIYAVPEDLDAIPDTTHASSESLSTASGLNRRNSAPSTRSASRAQDTGSAPVPQWQLLCDKYRNTFVGGVKVAELNGVNTIKWLAEWGHSLLRERLVVAARGILPPKPITEEDGIDFVDGGRILLVDFDYGLNNGEVTEVTIEVGTKEPEVLEEEHRDMDTEVAIVRRRTVAQKRGGPGAVLRSATTVAGIPPVPSMPLPPMPAREEELEDPLVPRRLGQSRLSELPAQEEDERESDSIIEAQEALDAPYAHASPRSGTTLRRAATAAAINRRLHPPPATAGRVQYRRADGRAEHPHESDADNWVPPPPPYQKDDPQDFPSFLRHRLQPAPGGDDPDSPQQQAPSQQGAPQPQVPAIQTSAPSARLITASQSSAPVSPHRRNASGSSVGRPPARGATAPTSPAASRDGEDDIYNASPTQSPQMTRSVPNARNASVSTEGSGFVTIPDVPTPSTSLPGSQMLPHIHTTAASRPQTPSSGVQPPVLGLQIPSPPSGPYAPNSPLMNSPLMRTLAHPQTWPNRPAAAGSPMVQHVGYPYSAPPTSMTADEAMMRSYAPPGLGPERGSGLGNNTAYNASPGPRHVSHASVSSQLTRVPVGSRADRRVSGQQIYHAQPFQPYPIPSQMLPPQQLQQVQAQSPHFMTTVTAASIPAPPPPEPPLIISTPRGVSGGFDAPIPQRSPSGAGAEQLIYAPVARRQHPSSVGPRSETVERFETIYGTPGTMYGSQGRPLPHQHVVIPGPYQQQQQPPQQPQLLTTSSLRQTSLNRRQSRAERSAARNMADAKRRGWPGRSKTKRVKKQKGKDFDAASSAAWTDVTEPAANQLGRQRPETRQRGLRGDKKCIMM